MQPINLPFKEREFRIKESNSGRSIWDICRRTYVALTPEEWVRQHLIWVMVEDFAYPKGMIAVEKWLQLDRVRRRYDIVVYAPDMQPYMLIECKAPSVPITKEALHQISHYYSKVPAKYMMLTNGSYSFVAEVLEKELRWLKEFPAYPSISI